MLGYLFKTLGKVTYSMGLKKAIPYNNEHLTYTYDEIILSNVERMRDEGTERETVRPR